MGPYKVDKQGNWIEKKGYQTTEIYAKERLEDYPTFAAYTHNYQPTNVE